MKASLVIAVAALFSSADGAEQTAKTEERIDGILHTAFLKRSDANAKADREYRAALTTTFQFADRFEVYLLEFSMAKDLRFVPEEDDETFPIRPYKVDGVIEARTKVLKKAKLPTKEIPAWCAAVTKMVTSDKEGGGAFCHYPIHGVRIYAGDKLLFETSVCWECNNFYFTYYTGESEWVHLTEDAEEIRKLLHEFMPIPEAEMARFKNK